MKNIVTVSLILISTLIFAQHADKPKFKYDDFKTPQYCGSSCHNDFYQMWKQSMMSQAYTHHWDEIEYFNLAVPHSEVDPKLSGIKADCNGCHTPIAYLVGEFPPPRPELNSRANESVSCEVCHSITGFEGDTPYNFNYVISPGKKKYTSRKGEIESPVHEIVLSPIHKSGDFCGICHNEMSPYGIWVKSTHLEWKEGPYSKEGVQCQDCHMPKAEFKTSSLGTTYPDARLHLFHGAHDNGKIAGTIELRIHPDIKEAEPGETVKFTLALYNQKTGHKFPSGSVEDRIVWLHVEATDASGKVYHLKVDKKGFKGEEYTISTDINGYFDLAIPLKIKDFKGIQRDGVPFGDRIFRMPYFDPNGQITIQQWNTASLGVDYRIGPRETKIETFTFNLPANLTPGKMKVKAVLNYQKLVSPVAKFLNVPDEEAEIVKVNEHSTELTILQ